MITAFAELAAQSLKAFNLIEENVNRPDIVTAKVQEIRQKYRDTIDAAQAVISAPNSAKVDRDHAFEFIQRIES